jgi:Domain of unknown function (DUF4440)
MNQTTNEGEKMEKQIWEDFKAKNWQAVESKIADGFQSVHPDGARDRAGEISLIKSLNVGQTALSDLKSTVNGDNIVVTYMISAQETIDLERLPTKPAPRLSVWKKERAGGNGFPTPISLQFLNTNPTEGQLFIVRSVRLAFEIVGRSGSDPIPNDISGR